MVPLDYFDVLMSKIIFFKKYHFNVFLNKKHFEKQPQPQSQTPLNKHFKTYFESQQKCFLETVFKISFSPQTQDLKNKIKKLNKKICC